MKSFHAIVVGQGLAGTALAWTFHLHGLEFFVIDEDRSSTSSKIAAGIVTPITGQRGVKSWAWDEAWPIANQFYSHIQLRTGSRFWHVHPALRLYDSQSERESIEGRLANHSSETIEAYILNENDEPSPFYDSSFGGFIMKSAAQLTTQNYLADSRMAFELNHAYRSVKIDLERDIESDREWIRIPRMEIQARFIILCLGYSPIANRWFPSLPFVAAQGDILTLDIPEFRETRTIHRKVWLTPAARSSTNEGASNYWAGSTYRWSPLDGLPSIDGRDQITFKINRWLKVPYNIVEHRAAIRPSSFDQRPLLGQSPLDSRVWVLNGLGTKGALLAPWCAKQLVDSLHDGSEVNPALHWNRKVAGTFHVP